MKTEPKQFPRTFKSSSAAYRAIRQYEEKTKTVTGLVMTRVDKKSFVVAQSAVLTVAEFKEKRPTLFYGETAFRYFPDGANGAGYYELKTGDRRRPNSKFETDEKVYNDLVCEGCKM
jgi:hypothetical protein